MSKRAALERAILNKEIKQHTEDTNYAEKSDKRFFYSSLQAMSVRLPVTSLG